jgi:hypothetical protein
LFLLLCFQNEPMLSLGQFCFFVVLGRYWWGKGSLLVWGLTRKLRNPSGLFVSVLFRVCFLSLSPTSSSVLLGLYRARPVDNGR